MYYASHFEAYYLLIVFEVVPHNLDLLNNPSMVAVAVAVTVAVV